MKGAIATVDFFIRAEGEATGRRLSLVVAAPERASSGDGAGGWVCRVALADFHPSETIVGFDSFHALARAISRAKFWLDELREQGYGLSRDLDGRVPFELL